MTFLLQNRFSANFAINSKLIIKCNWWIILIINFNKFYVKKNDLN